MRDYQESVTTRQTHGQADRQTPDKVIPMCRYAMQATEKYLKETRHVFVKHRCPLRQQSQTMAKICKFYILTPPHPQGYVMSVKCEQPLDDLQPNFGYCMTTQTLNIAIFYKRDRITDRQTERQTDGRFKH